MRLFVTALSVPVLLLSGAVALTAYSMFRGAVCFSSPPPPHPVACKIGAPAYQLDDVVRILAQKHGVRQEIVKSIIIAESANDPAAVSRRGAIGLMQLMPDTAREYGVNPTIVEQNIEGGTRYIGNLLHRYRHCKNSLQRSIAAYNAGPGNVDKYRGVPPFRETRKYVKRVMTLYRRLDKTPVRTWKSARARTRVEDAD